MAENMPLNFVIPGENVLATYSYTDIANGAGYVDFYPFITRNGPQASPTVSYQLAISSSQNTADKQITTSNAEEYNFDSSPFNTPRVAKGLAYLKIVVKQNAGTRHYAIRLLKVSSSVESVIATGMDTMDVTTAEQIFVLKFDISTEVNFMIGDFIRLEVTDVSSSGNGYFGTSPLNEASTNLTAAQAKLSIPFKIEI